MLCGKKIGLNISSVLHLDVAHAPGKVKTFDCIQFYFSLLIIY